MNKATKREIVATLVKAGRRDLAQHVVHGSVQAPTKKDFADAGNRLHGTITLIRDLMANSHGQAFKGGGASKVIVYDKERRAWEGVFKTLKNAEERYWKIVNAMQDRTV